MLSNHTIQNSGRSRTLCSLPALRFRAKYIPSDTLCTFRMGATPFCWLEYQLHRRFLRSFQCRIRHSESQ